MAGELELALGRLLHGEPPPLTCAGRTDAGVHARGQVAHADVGVDALPDAPALAELARRLRRALPRDIGLRAVSFAPPGFDARFSAVWRRYAYRVCDDPAGPDPLRRHEVLAHPRPLDLDLLNQASQPLLGVADFATFCRRRVGATTVRELRRLEWSRDDSGWVVADVVADAFCHSMVRSLVGALLAVGEGRRDVAFPATMLAARRRSHLVHVVAAHGLTLEEVGYPSEAEMALRASRARARRLLGPTPGQASAAVDGC